MSVLRLLLLCSWLAPTARAVHIDNTIPRRDTHGNIINAHDGHIQLFQGAYWLYGTSYTHCNMTDQNSCLGTCGWEGVGKPPDKCAFPISPGSKPNHPACGWTNNDFAAYTSRDLVTWTLRNPSLLPADMRPNGVYFRPKVVYNAHSNLYVLWFNFVTEGQGDYCSTLAEFPNCWSTYGTATSPTPDGPFKIVELPVLMGTRNASYAHGDFALMVDGANSYILYNAYDHRGSGQHSNSIDLLTPDFTSSTQQTSGFFAEWYNGTDSGGDEAQVLFERDGVYYAIIASGCCFCSGGSTAMVYTATTPLGPYTYTGHDLNLQASPPREQGRTIPAQQAFVAALEVKGGGVQYMWGGDRWQSAPDGFKSHDYQAWVPLEFGPRGEIKALQWLQQWDVDLA